MRAPDWWGARRGGLLSSLLAPLAWAYGAGMRARFAAARPWRSAVPVLCVGNLVAGGAGKTPVALSLGARLMSRGIDVRFLVRGYGGACAGPLRVDAARHGACQVGDEALLLAGCAPTWVARDRRSGARAAVADGAAAIVMDDGFQNPSLAKDVSFVVVDGGYGLGNGRLIPAGPLREPPKDAMGRADAMVLIGDDAWGAVDRIAGLAGEPRPVLRARIVPGPEAGHLAGRPVVAFAGIGRPQKFFDTLSGIGCNLKAAHAYPDHHVYGDDDIERLRREAAAAGALAVTTAKDAARLSPAARRGIEVLTITLEWEDEVALDATLGGVFTR